MVGMQVAGMEVYRNSTILLVKGLLIFLSLFVILQRGHTQDPQFSQFYANSLYLAPSFAGLTDGSRVGLNYRNQWPQIPGKFVTYTFSYDHFFDAFNSGAGILIMRDQAGSGNLATTSAGFQYSYDFPINQTWHARPGVYFYYTERSVDFYKLIFSDQIRPGGNLPTSIENPTLGRVGSIDFATSAMVYSPNYWIGFSIDHLLKPNQSLYDWVEDDFKTAIVPIKLSLFGGTKIIHPGRLLRPLAESLQFAFLYKRQGDFTQLDLGMYWYKNPLVIGAWYRGVPGLSNGGRDAAVFLVGYKIDQFNIGYSYDFSVSRLITSTGGAHEISITYSWKSIRVPKKPRMVPCPDF